MSNFQSIPISFSATELSLMWHGVKILIERQKEIIKNSKPPYTLTDTGHLESLVNLQKKLKKINIDIEALIIKEIRK